MSALIHKYILYSAQSTPTRYPPMKPMLQDMRDPGVYNVLNQLNMGLQWNLGILGR